MTAVRRLLKSCAMPPVNCPSASNFCAWCQLILGSLSLSDFRFQPTVYRDQLHSPLGQLLRPLGQLLSPIRENEVEPQSANKGSIEMVCRESNRRGKYHCHTTHGYEYHPTVQQEASS